MANSITPSLENRSTLSIFLSVSLFLSVILISKRRYVQQSLDDFFPPIRLTASPPPKQLHSSDPDISREPNSVVIDAESEQPPVSVEAKNIVEIVVDSAGDEDVTSEREKAMRESLKDCDLYMGSWVRDEGYPIYTPGSCEYVDEAFDCQNNARPDSDYLHWRWKPHGCDLPRFNAADFLERLRGKKLLLVGDSMNRNQFESILCLLREGLPNKTRMFEINGHKITKGRGSYVFKFLDYNCSVEYALSHYLVKEGVRVNGRGNSNPTLSIDKVDKTSKKWKRADIIVFNTGHWWNHRKTSRADALSCDRVYYYKEGEYIYPHLDANEAYRRALQTWGRWIDQNLNTTRQLVFYRGYSSPHFRGGEWDSGGSCYNEKEPILSEQESIVKSYPFKMKVLEEVIKGMKFPVRLLNVTRLTNFRKDGHPSVYRKNRITRSSSKRAVQDCSHWCLPGVPDAWNELIYANLILK
ncbi:Protein trichome birefringence-like 5 [Linum perenne]